LKFLRICFGTAFREISFKDINVREAYISPYCRPVLVPPNSIKFGIRVQLTEVITCVKFLVDRFI